MRPLYLLLTSLAVAALFGCQPTKYIDKPAGPGAIPEAEKREPTVRPIEQRSYGDPSQRGIVGDRVSLDTLMTREGSGDESIAAAVERFRGAYASRGKPRLAVFLNRSLSDEVREWKTESRDVISGDGSITTSTVTEHGTERDTITGDISLYEQKHIEDKARAGVAEGYLWSFEDGFVQPFLRAGTRLVDRATIMRLAAAESGKQGDAYDLMAVKKIEMDALLGKADILVELLITRHPSSPYGYEFKASAKDIRTGTLIANATSANWSSKDRAKKINVISSGYEVTDKFDGKDLPIAADVATELAVELMDSLVNIWELSR